MTTLARIDDGERATLRSAAGWLLVLGPLFFLVYGFTNWLSAQRSDVGVFFFAWERTLPFIPWLIVPYMSIDLFYAAAPFVCETRREQRVLARRMAFALGLATVCFLLVPLQLGFTRPAYDGVFAPLFSLLSFDRAFNLFPSLHIALAIVVWSTFRRHTRGWVRGALAVWFPLIGWSTLGVYQHHFIDVPGGALVGLLACRLFRDGEDEESLGATVGGRRFQIGLNYALLSALVWGLVWAGQGWRRLLAWPALSLALMAAVYWFWGPGFFAKRDGRLPLATRLLLGPVLLGLGISAWLYRRRAAAWNAVGDRLLLGRKLNAREARRARREGVAAVLDVTAERAEAKPLLDLRYKNVRMLDLVTPSAAQLAEAVDFVRDRARPGKVFVHCSLGYSRSALVAAAYLIAEDGASVEDAVAHIRRARPAVVFRADDVAALAAFAGRRAREGPMTERSAAA